LDFADEGEWIRFRKVRDDAYDRPPASGPGRGSESDPFPERVFAGPETPRRDFVDDRDGGGRGVLPPRPQPSPFDARAQGGEVAEIDRIGADAVAGRGGYAFCALDGDGIGGFPRPPSRRRLDVADAYRLDVRDLEETLA
jgi:hypothetical protein